MQQMRETYAWSWRTLQNRRRQMERLAIDGETWHFPKLPVAPVIRNLRPVD